MKNYLAIALISIAFVTSCSTAKTKNPQRPDKAVLKTYTPPKTGQKVAEIRERIKEDRLNKLYFAVQIQATDSSRQGKYLVLMTYGYAKDKAVVDFPKWTGGHYPRPLIQTDTPGYRARLGFDVGDGSFRPFYLIWVTKKSLRMKQTNRYLTE